MLRTAAAATAVLLTGVGAVVSAVPAQARPADPGVVSYAVLAKGSVGNIVGAPDDVGIGEYHSGAELLGRPAGLQQLGRHRAAGGVLRPDLASFNSAVTQTSATDQNHLVKQAIGVFATVDAATRAYHRVIDRTAGCAGQTTAMHLDDGTTQVWSFGGAAPTATDAVWVKQEADTDRRCFTQSRLREKNVLLQAKVCQSGNGGPAVNVLAGAMQNTLGL